MVERFYVAVEQEVLLFGSETMVLNPRLDKSLKGFYHRAARQMEVMGPNYHQEGT